jgi:predicted PurR-regulated permease PerM
MASGVTSSLTRLMRVASVVICLIVSASFLVFVVNQTSSASARQQNELNEGSAQAPSSSPSVKHESTLHRALDDTSNALTSPFAGIVSGSGQWTVHIVRTVLALLVYGFGLAFLVRFIRVRV